MSDLSTFSLPTNKADIQKIENAILEISAQLQMIKDRQDSIKDIKSDLKDTFDMPTGLINKLVKAHFEHKYDEMTEENSVFELVYETLFGDATPEEDQD
jgi:uncharacterized membrane protein YcaP (DUF421 family)